MTTDDAPTVGRLALVLGVFVVIGVPIIAVLWDAANEVISGRFTRLTVAVPALAVFIVFLFVLARRLRRLE